MVSGLRRALEGLIEAPRQEHRKVQDPTWTNWRVEAPTCLRSALDEFINDSKRRRSQVRSKTDAYEW